MSMDQHKAAFFSALDVAVGGAGGLVTLNQWFELADHIVATCTGIVTICWFIYRFITHRND